MKFKIIKYKVVNSTNETAIQLIKNKKCENGLIYSLFQKKGKGRHGKKWISKKGNFFGTIFFHLKKNYPTEKEFSFINLILNTDVLSKFCDKKNIIIKFPNDIYVNKKKICGILQEVIFRGSKKYLIIGIGINLLSSPKINKYPSTSVYEEIKIKPKLSKIVKQIKKKYEDFFLYMDFYKVINFKIKSKKMYQN